MSHNDYSPYNFAVCFSSGVSIKGKESQYTLRSHPYVESLKVCYLASQYSSSASLSFCLQEKIKHLISRYYSFITSNHCQTLTRCHFHLSPTYFTETSPRPSTTSTSHISPLALLPAPRKTYRRIPNHHEILQYSWNLLVLKGIGLRLKSLIGGWGLYSQP